MAFREELRSVVSSLRQGQSVDWRSVEQSLENESERELLRKLLILADHSSSQDPSLLEGTSSSSPTESFEVPRFPEKAWAHLEVLEVIGSGAFGTVFRALETRLNTEVALKLVPMSRLAASPSTTNPYEEARMLARIHHPNVVRVFGVEIHDGWLGMWTELIEGQHLDDRLDDAGVLGAAEAAALGSELCRALAALHNEGLIHGDIKCSNVMRDKSGRIVLMDFGLVQDLRIEANTALKSMRGTPLYMAPELLLGGRPTVASDIYALSVLLFRLVTGRYPIEADSLDALIEACLTRAGHRLLDLRPDLPLEFVRALEKGLSIEPEERYASAGEFEDALRDGPQKGSTPRATRQKPSNLPVAISNFVGREQESEELLALFGGKRLITVTGPGGCGKTRLALHVAEAVAGEREVCFVGLAHVKDADHLPSAVAAALGIQVSSDADPWQGLIRSFAGRTPFFLVDNCEHLVEAAGSLVTALLGLDPAVRILATSRQPLGLDGEQVYSLSPLRVPPRDIGAEEAVATDSVGLFVDRARLVFPAFELTDENVGILIDICGKLDGIPLAIELAAARAGMLSLSQIDQRLENRFRILTRSGTAELPHHQTLRTLVDWSFDLLSKKERLLFQRLAVFRGGWTLEAAEAVCGFDGLDESEILDLHASLVRQSLVEVDRNRQGSDLRYSMLETIADFAREQLAASGGGAAVGAEHGTFYEKWADDFRSNPDPPQGLDLVAREERNLLHALGRARETVDRKAMAVFASLLSRYWANRGYLALGLATCEQLLKDVSWSGHTSLRAEVENALGSLAWRSGDYVRAEKCYERVLEDAADPIAATIRIDALRGLGATAFSLGERSRARETWQRCLKMAREERAPRFVATCLNNLANVCYVLGETEAALHHAEESVRTWRKLQDRAGRVSALNTLALIHLRQGQMDEAEQLFKEMLRTATEAGNRQAASIAQNNLGLMQFRQEVYSRAQVYFENSLKLSEKIHNQAGVALALRNLGSTLEKQGQLERAEELQLESLELARRLGDREGEAHTLGNLASLADQRGNPEESLKLRMEQASLMTEINNVSGTIETLDSLVDLFCARDEDERAALLVGTLEALRQSVGLAPSETQRTTEESRKAGIETRLGTDAFRRAVRQGREREVTVILTALADGLTERDET